MAGQNPSPLSKNSTSAEAIKALANSEQEKAAAKAETAAKGVSVPEGHDMIRLLRPWQQDQNTWHQAGVTLVVKRGEYPSTAIVVKAGDDE